MFPHSHRLVSIFPQIGSHISIVWFPYPLSFYSSTSLHPHPVIWFPPPSPLKSFISNTPIIWFQYRHNLVPISHNLLPMTHHLFPYTMVTPDQNRPWTRKAQTRTSCEVHADLQKLLFTLHGPQPACFITHRLGLHIAFLTSATTTTLANLPRCWNDESRFLSVASHLTQASPSPY